MEAALLDLQQQARLAGSTALLSFNTVGGTLKAKFEIDFASISSPPANPTPTPTATTHAPGGDCCHCQRRRRHGPAAVSHLHARAAAHLHVAMPPLPTPPTLVSYPTR